MSVINTNITSVIAQKNLTSSKSALTTAMERLSSGLRINSAKDDAAGQAITNRMTAQVKGLAQAQRNANDGISVAQTAEGALNQVNDNLQRIRELSVQAANETNSGDDLTSIQNEIGQRLEEINRISKETSFNGVNVLAGDEELSIQVGAQDGQIIKINLKEINASTLGLSGFNVDGKGETPNTAATKDSLTLAKAAQVGTTNEYKLSTTNNDASVLGVLGKAVTGDTLAIGSTTYTRAADGSFTYGETYTEKPVDALKSAMQPALGETKTATVTIGGQDTKITIASDGKITATESGNNLYLDSTGNLTETAAGNPPAATIDNLAQSLAGRSGSSIAIDGGATYTTSATATALTNSAGGTVANAALATDLAAAAQSQALGERAELSVTLNGSTQTVFVGADGSLATANDGSAANLYFDANGNLSTDNTGTAATATSLADNVSKLGGSVTIVAAGGTGSAANVSNTYSGNGLQVAASGLTTSASGVSDALKAASDGTYTLTLNNGSTTAEQNITFTVASGAVTGTAFNGGGGSEAIANGAVKVSSADGSLTAAATSDTSYFLQENGNVTNASGQRIYQDAAGKFTTAEVTTGTRTTDPLKTLDAALKTIDSLRSDLGAVQNRFESAITNLSTNETNITAARSRIQDADYAVEVGNMTRAQILQQAGTSVLAQANQLPQGVLSLLR